MKGWSVECLGVGRACLSRVDGLGLSVFQNSCSDFCASILCLSYRHGVALMPFGGEFGTMLHFH